MTPLQAQHVVSPLTRAAAELDDATRPLVNARRQLERVDHKLAVRARKLNNDLASLRSDVSEAAQE